MIISVTIFLKMSLKSERLFCYTPVTVKVTVLNFFNGTIDLLWHLRPSSNVESFMRRIKSFDSTHGRFDV